MILKKTRIVFMTASLMLLLITMIGISASAGEAEVDYTYEIPLVNISHGASSAMLFAIDAPIEDAEAGKVIVTYTYFQGVEEITARAKYSKELTEESNLGKPVFYTIGISPKDQGEPLKVEAHSSDAPQDFEPDYYVTSVGKYLFAKLYRDGFINSETENGKRLAKMYLAQIEYVSTCQDALWNSKNLGAERKLLNTYSYICVDDGVIASTGTSHDFVDEESVTLTYTGFDALRVGWNVTTYGNDGSVSTSCVLGDTVTVTGNTVVTPYFERDVVDFESFKVGDLIVNGQYSQNDTVRISSESEDYSAEIVKDRNGDNALQPSAYIWLYSKNYADDRHNVSLLDMDIDANVLASNAIQRMHFRTGATGTFNQFRLEWRYVSSSAQLRFDVMVPSDTSYNSTHYYTLPKGNETNPLFNLKVEYLWKTGVLRITVDDTVVYCGAILSSATPVYRVYCETNSKNTLLFDNIKQNTTYVDPLDFTGSEN